ncbi:MAG TPA: tetratricopeptide repeat protein [Gemmatimonadales bacterium]|jgi:tetratricopeptide (TPR) repeat protein
MPAARSRDAQIVAALGRRLAAADATTLTNFAWFAARRGAHPAALEAARRAVTHGDAPRAAWRALERLAAGRTDGMLLTADAAEPAAPEPPRNPLAAAVSAHAQGQLAVAEACYLAALPQDALAAAASNGLAVLHEQRRERAAADAAWQHSVAEGNVAGRHNQALAMLRRGLPHRARANLAPLVVGAGAPAVLRFLAGYAALADQDPHAAIAILTTPGLDESARAQFTLGLACERLGRHDEALVAIRRALLMSPWYAPQVWLLQATADAALTEIPADLGESGALAHTADVLLSLGRSLLQTGHLGEALAVFDQVLTQQPSEPAALFHRGVVLAKLRRYGEALDDWERAGQADPASELGDASLRHARSARQLATLFASR